jgi:cytochrome c peroxidase
MRITYLLIIPVTLLVVSCKKEAPSGPCDNCADTDLIETEYAPEFVQLELPSWAPDPLLNKDNPLTKQGIALGKRLFFDPLLSSDGTVSCASCHDPAKSFTDGEAVSTGIDGKTGTRSAMALVNLAFHSNGFFWDGRSPDLESQVIVPITDPREMNESPANVMQKLRSHAEYPVLFKQAFGVERKSEMTIDQVAMAIAQFERTLNSFNSRFDRVVWLNEGWFTDEEERGRQLFFIEPFVQIDNHPGCSHCHLSPLFMDNAYRNNGLDSVATVDDFEDPGYGAVTGKIFDQGKFKVPTLRNIALTAPYMHDGRFETLEEVLENYAKGGHGVINEDSNILPFKLDAQQKADLIAFLNTLTDTSFVNNPAFRQ